jgi:hypothetical protein
MTEEDKYFVLLVSTLLGGGVLCVVLFVIFL